MNAIKRAAVTLKIENDKGAKAEPPTWVVSRFDSGAVQSFWQAEIT
jgi:hypothetical protein